MMDDFGMDFADTPKVIKKPRVKKQVEATKTAAQTGERISAAKDVKASRKKSAKEQNPLDDLWVAVVHGLDGKAEFVGVIGGEGEISPIQEVHPRAVLLFKSGAEASEHFVGGCNDQGVERASKFFAIDHHFDQNHFVEVELQRSLVLKDDAVPLKAAAKNYLGLMAAVKCETEQDLKLIKDQLKTKELEMKTIERDMQNFKKKYLA